MSNYAILDDFKEKHYEIIECSEPVYYFNKCLEKGREMIANNEFLFVKVYMLDYSSEENEDYMKNFIKYFENNGYTESAVSCKILS